MSQPISVQDTQFTALIHDPLSTKPVQLLSNSRAFHLSCHMLRFKRCVTAEVMCDVGLRVIT
jgi:hypothetical protein